MFGQIHLDLTCEGRKHSQPWKADRLISPSKKECGLAQQLAIFWGRTEIKNELSFSKCESAVKTPLMSDRLPWRNAAERNRPRERLRAPNAPMSVA